VLIKKDALLTAAKQRLQIEAQTEEISDGTIRANTQLDDQLLTSAKQRDELDERIDLLQTQDRGETYRIDNLLPEELKTARLSQQALRAQTEDQTGFAVQPTGDPVYTDNLNTTHYNTVQELKWKASSTQFTREEILPATKDKETNSATLLSKQADVEMAKEALTNRQTKGFDENRRQKAIDKALDIWSVAFSALPASDTIPINFNASVVNGTPGTAGRGGLWYDAAAKLQKAIGEPVIGEETTGV
jgi:hypothetical protein